MARFTSLEEWAQTTSVPKRIRQALLWIVATGDPTKSTAPTLAVLAMAGQHGLTKRELKKVLGVDVSGVLGKLRSEGAIEQGMAGVLRLKLVSRLLGSEPKRKQPDRMAFGPRSRLISQSDWENPINIKKKSKPKRSGRGEDVDSLARDHVRTRESSIGSIERSSSLSSTDRSISTTRNQGSIGERSEPIDPKVASTDSKVTGVGKRLLVESQKPKRGGRSFSANPSKRPTFQEWKWRKPPGWDPDSCFGYWLHRYRETYGIEDPRYVGEPVKDQKRMAFGVMTFIKSERGLNGEVGQWKEYVDWLLDKFAPTADWLGKALRLGQVIRLPNGKPNFFLAEFRESKAKLPAKKKRKTELKHRTWGYEEVEVEE